MNLLSKELSPAVFRMYFTKPPEDYQPKKRTGIGLAAFRKIAEMPHGKITYQRRINPDGSIFIVMLKKKQYAKKQNGLF